MVSWMGAFINAAEISRLMTSHCRRMDFKSNVLNDVGDGVAANVSTAGLLMVWLSPFATNLAFKDEPCCPGLLLMTHLVLMIFLSSSGVKSDELTASNRSLLCKDVSSVEMASLTAVSLYWLMSSS